MTKKTPTPTCPKCNGTRIIKTIDPNPPFFVVEYADCPQCIAIPHNKTWKTPHFSSAEFDSPDLPGSGIYMDSDFIRKLQIARNIANTPFSINSGYRTKVHNHKIKGSKDSAHTKGKACDIHTQSSRYRYLILSALLKAGFNRLGIYPTFIHVDDDYTKPLRVIWHA